MKNILQIILFLIALIINACVEVSDDQVSVIHLQPIEVKDIRITLTEGDTVYINLNDSIVANRTYVLKLIPNKIGYWKPVNDSLFSYTCTPSYPGSDTAYYEACPTDESCIRAKIILNILKREIPCQPKTSNDTLFSKIGQPLLINILENDSLCGSPKTLSFSDFTGGGTLRAEGFGFRFTQDSSFSTIPRSVRFNYTVCDYNDKCATGTVVIYPQTRSDFCAEKYKLVNDYITSTDSISLTFNWELLLRNDRYCPQDLVMSAFFIAPTSANRSFTVNKYLGSNLYRVSINKSIRRPYTDSVLYTIPSLSFGASQPKRAHLVIRFE